MFLQTIMTLKMGVTVYFRRRLVVTAVGCSFLFIGIGLACGAAIKATGSAVVWNDEVHGLNSTAGRLSVAAAVCEWIVCLCIVAFTATFVPEFRNYEIHHAQVTDKRKTPTPAAARLTETEMNTIEVDTLLEEK